MSEFPPITRIINPRVSKEDLMRILGCIAACNLLSLCLYWLSPRREQSTATNTIVMRQTVDNCATVRSKIVCAPSALLEANPNYSLSEYEIIWEYLENGIAKEIARNVTSVEVNKKGQYTVEYRYRPGNQAKNGNFEKGNNGEFTSAYTYKADDGKLATTSTNSELWGEKTYTIVNNPALVHTNFPNNIRDHTSGSSLMMLINGSTDLNVNIWQQQITVKPNTCYVFTTFATSVTPTAPANLIFSINNVQFGVIQLTSTVNRWDEFNRTWYSGNNTTATIAIVNRTTEHSGNDFALDDISFMPYEKEIINVDLQPDKPDIGTNYP